MSSRETRQKTIEFGVAGVSSAAGNGRSAVSNHPPLPASCFLLPPVHHNTRSFSGSRPAFARFTLFAALTTAQQNKVR